MLFSLSAFAQTSSELSGNVIYFDGGNVQTNTPADAFDGNLNTYFNSVHGQKNWIGLDFGEKKVITQIGFAPRIDNDYRNRLVLGVFEGANNPDFGDAIPLYIIPGSVERELILQDIDCSRGFRYVRFVFPMLNEVKSSYMSEVKFYGYAGEGDDTRLPQIAGIPIVSIHTTNAEDITSQEVYIQGIVTVISADGKTFHSDSLNIRGRGNNSWTYPKKPYRMKLYKKAVLPDMTAKAKNWTLINNFGDKTLMRNLLAFEISRRLELPYTPAGQAVNLFLNGDYKGCYQLCDQVEVNPGRVETDELDPTDMILPNLSGGYLLEIDAYAYGEPVWFTSDPNMIPVTIKYPDDDEINAEQRTYIETHFNKFVSSVNASNYQTINGFRKYVDTPSFLRRLMAVEFAGNTDSYWSYYIYKKRGDDKFYSSPIWDLDLAFENDWRTYPINTRTGDQWIFASTGSCANGMRQLLDRMLTDSRLVEEMEQLWAWYRDRNRINTDSLLHYTDSLAQMLDASQQLNFTRWQIMNQTIHENPVIHGSYEAEVENVKNYIADRMVWFDNKLHYTPGSTISHDASLSDLSVTGATLLPNFDPEWDDYEVKLPFGVNAIEIAATATDSFAVVEGVGRQTLTGITTEFEITVTAEDGVTQRTYTIKATVEGTGVEAIFASNDKVLLEVYSLQGVLLHRQEVNHESLAAWQKRFPSGCYIVRISDAARSKIFKKIIK